MASNTDKNVELTMIKLTPEEAKMFVQFQKRRAFMDMMESVNAFDIKGGFVTIHFDNLGGVGSIDVQRRYRIIS